MGELSSTPSRTPKLLGSTFSALQTSHEFSSRTSPLLGRGLLQGHLQTYHRVTVEEAMVIYGRIQDDRNIPPVIEAAAEEFARLALTAVIQEYRTPGINAETLNRIREKAFALVQDPSRFGERTMARLIQSLVGTNTASTIDHLIKLGTAAFERCEYEMTMPSSNLTSIAHALAYSQQPTAQAFVMNLVFRPKNEPTAELALQALSESVEYGVKLEPELSRRLTSFILIQSSNLPSEPVLQERMQLRLRGCRELKALIDHQAGTQLNDVSANSDNR
jgi:hypothetical protein